ECTRDPVSLKNGDRDRRVLTLEMSSRAAFQELRRLETLSVDDVDPTDRGNACPGQVPERNPAQKSVLFEGQALERRTTHRLAAPFDGDTSDALRSMLRTGWTRASIELLIDSCPGTCGLV